MQLDESLAQCESKPGSFLRCRTGRAEAPEFHEQCVQLFRCDTDTCIDNRDFKSLLGLTCLDGHLSAGVGELDGVREKIEHDLLETALIGAPRADAGFDV